MLHLTGQRMSGVLLLLEEVFLTEEVEVEADLTLEKYIVYCVGDKVILLTNVSIGLTEIFNVFPVKILAEEDYLNLIQELIL